MQHYSAPPPALPPPADPAASSPWGPGGEARSETASLVKGQKGRQQFVGSLGHYFSPDWEGFFLKSFI